MQFLLVFYKAAQLNIQNLQDMAATDPEVRW